MRPLDPRLVAGTRSVRVHMVVTVACGAALTGLIVAQAWLIARIVATGTGDDPWPAVAAVGFVALARVALSYGAETAALRSAATVKSELRRKLVEAVTAHGATGGTDTGAVATLAGRGLDALDDYIARYLPQLVLSVIVPVAVLAVVARADWISAIAIGVTLPLIPLFMALIGWHTQASTQKQWRLLERLGGQFLDVVEGLPTLAVFRRAKAEAELIRTVTGEHRRATMGTLRTAFLSAFVLELLATLAVAVVAVEVGLRLLYGGLDLETALLVLILAPEAYLPLREVGARFHAAQEGAAVTDRILGILADAAGQAPGRPAPRPERITVEGVTLVHPGARRALDDVDLELRAGRTLLLTGRSGSGKSSLLGLLLRFTAPTAGRITVTGPDGAALDLAELDADAWRRRIAWVPQRPYLFDTSAADNIRLGAPDATLDAVRRAAELAGIHDVITALPQGYATRLGEHGTRLSAGQRQRIALARAFLIQDADIVLLDEPTAHLDPHNAELVRAAAVRLLAGRTAVIVAHDDGWADIADDVVVLDAGRVAAAPVPARAAAVVS